MLELEIVVPELLDAWSGSSYCCEEQFQYVALPHSEVYISTGL